MDRDKSLTGDVMRRRVEMLEAANHALIDANRRLARDWLGCSDAAAASVLARYSAVEGELQEKDKRQRERIRELEAEVLQVGDERADLQRQVLRFERKKIVRLAMRLDGLRPSQRG